MCRLPCAHSNAGTSTQPLFAPHAVCAPPHRVGTIASKPIRACGLTGWATPMMGHLRGWLRPMLQPHQACCTNASATEDPCMGTPCIHSQGLHDHELPAGDTNTASVCS